MPEETTNKESQAQSIIEEDKDLVIGVEEVQRIVMLYLGREALSDELQRFEGMKESELKILTDYLNEEKTKTQDETKIAGDANKIQGDLVNKEMKIQGDNALQQMKQLGAVPPGTMPAQGQPLLPQAPMAPTGVPQAPMEAPGKKFAQDGRFFPVRFSE